MIECPINLMTCDKCDYRKVRNFDYVARRICEGCANYHGEEEE